MSFYTIKDITANLNIPASTVKLYIRKLKLGSRMGTHTSGRDTRIIFLSEDEYTLLKTYIYEHSRVHKEKLNEET